MKVKFKNWLSDHDRVRCAAGSRWKPVYAPLVQEDGSIELVEKGKTNIYEEIQSWKDTVDINRIIQRYANGDISALNARAAQFMDAVDLPQNYAEMLQVAIDAQNFFDELPAKVKAEFDNSYYKFIASIGSDTFKSAFGIQKEAAAADPAPVQDDKKGADVSE